MSIALLWFFIGLFVGANLGIIAAGLCVSAKDAHKPRAQQRADADREQNHGEVVIVHHPHIA